MKDDEVRVCVLDVRPYRYGYRCYVAGKMIVNAIVHRTWCSNGTRILFGLETGNAFDCLSDGFLELVPLVPKMSAELLREIDERDARIMREGAPWWGRYGARCDDEAASVAP